MSFRIPAGMSSSAAMKVLSGRRCGRAIGRANTIVWKFAFQPSGHYSVVVVRLARVDRKVCTSSVVNSFGLNYDKFVRFHFISPDEWLLSTGWLTVYWTCGQESPGLLYILECAVVVVVMILHYDDWVLNLDHHPCSAARRTRAGRSCGSLSWIIHEANAWHI